MAINPLTGQTQIDMRSSLAQALLGQGMQSGPIRHPMEGFARLAQTLSGALLQRRAEDERKANEKSRYLEMRKLGEALMGMGDDAPLLDQARAVPANLFGNEPAPTTAAASPYAGLAQTMAGPMPVPSQPVAGGGDYATIASLLGPTPPETPLSHVADPSIIERHPDWAGMTVGEFKEQGGTSDGLVGAFNTDGGSAFPTEYPERGPLSPTGMPGEGDFLASIANGKNVADLDPAMISGLTALIQNAPPEIRAGLTINSGYRSNEEQTRLWEEALRKYGDPEIADNWVARPGGSRHEHGDAVDIGWRGGGLSGAPQEAVSYLHDNAGRYGLAFPLSNEPWHIETVAARGGGAPTVPAPQPAAYAQLAGALTGAPGAAGAPPPPMAAPAPTASMGLPAASGGGFRMDPRIVAIAQHLLGNPDTAAQGVEFLMEAAMQQPAGFEFQEVGNTLLRIGPDGSVTPVYSAPGGGGEQPSSVQEFQFAQQNGFQGNYTDFLNLKRAGVEVNLPPQIGSIQPGYRMIYDEQGRPVAMEPIPGGPAAQEAAQAAAADAQKAAQAGMYADIVTEDIGRIFDILDTAEMPTTGIGGWFSSGVRGTPAFDVSELLVGIKGAIAFNRMSELRAASPTGSTGLGALTAPELNLLEGAYGSLEQSQSEEQFRRNLARVNNIYLDTIHGIGQGPPRMPLDGTAQPGAPAASGGIPPDAEDTATNPNTGERLYRRGDQWYRLDGTPFNG